MFYDIYCMQGLQKYTHNAVQVLTLAGAQGLTHLNIKGRIQTEDNFTSVLALCFKAQFLIKPNATANRVKGTNNVKFILNTKQPPYKIQMSCVKDPNE